MNCRAGDLAVIVGGDPRNVGAFVDVKRPTLCPHCGAPSWQIVALRPLVVPIFGFDALVTRTGVHDADLKPIRGDAKKDDVDQVEQVEVVA